MIRRLLYVLIASLAATGCPSIRRPGYLHPGPAEVQRNQAQRFDPYPLPDIGPYDPGIRPLDFDRPSPENERNQSVYSFVERYHQSPPPAIYRAPRTPVGTPVLPAPLIQQEPPFFAP